MNVRRTVEVRFLENHESSIKGDNYFQPYKGREEGLIIYWFERGVLHPLQESTGRGDIKFYGSTLPVTRPLYIFNWFLSDLRAETEPWAGFKVWI